MATPKEAENSTRPTASSMATTIRRSRVMGPSALYCRTFTIGNEFRVSQLKAMGRQAIIVGILQAVTATVLLDLALILLHLIRPVWRYLGS